MVPPRRSEVHSSILLLGEVFDTFPIRWLGDSHHSCADTRSRPQVKTRLCLPVRSACHYVEAPHRLPNYLFLEFLSGLSLFLDYLHFHVWHQRRDRFGFLLSLFGFFGLSPPIVSSAHGYTSVFPKLPLLLGFEHFFCSLPFLYLIPPHRPRFQQ